MAAQVGNATFPTEMSVGDDIVVQVSDNADDGILDKFFPQYDVSFVLPDEKETLQGFGECLALNHGPEHQRLARRYGEFRELILIAHERENGDVVGGANLLVASGLVADEAGATTCTVNLNYLFVVPRFRGRRLSIKLLETCKAVVSALIDGWCEQGCVPNLSGGEVPIFLEIADPFLLSDSQFRMEQDLTGTDALRRLKYWAERGARIVDFPYVQPALSEAQVSDQTLVLGMIGATSPHLSSSLLRGHLERFFAISTSKGKGGLGSPDVRGQLSRLRQLELASRSVELLPIEDAFSRVAADFERQDASRPRNIRDAIRGKSVAYFTVSFLFDHARLRAFPQIGVGEKDLEELALNYAGSRPLGSAIGPMFDDIADRDRNLFLKDFLIDTPNGVGVSDSKENDSKENLYAKVELRLPREVEWETEGRHVKFDVSDHEISFPDVTCHAFWVGHSTSSFSYHISFAVPYSCCLEDYFGLSLLQKVLSPTENTDWLLTTGTGLTILNKAVGTGEQSEQSWLEFLQEAFEAHFGSLAKQIQTLKVKRGAVSECESVTKEICTRAWHDLILHAKEKDNEDLNAAVCDDLPKLWSKSQKQRRVLVVLHDARLFDRLCELSSSPRKRREILEIDPVRPRNDGSLNSENAGFPGEILQKPDVLRRLGDNETGSERLDYFFLSGFTQNVIDFFWQDGLEVYDGAYPLFPEMGQNTQNLGYFLYATASSMYEIVKRSRSLGVGTSWIGTCPYLFLVHITAMHNEWLVQKYEKSVDDVVRSIEKSLEAQSKSMGQDWTILDEILDEMNTFKLRTFKDVHKHYSFNIFRYDTERAFFQELEQARGTPQRWQYWNRVLEQLKDTIASQRDQMRDGEDRRLNRIVIGISILSIFQLVFMAFDPKFTQWNDLCWWRPLTFGNWIFIVIPVAACWWARRPVLKWIRARRAYPSRDR